MGAAGLRETRRRATETTLERVALDLFGQRGFDRVTMDDVAAAAGVSTRTAFRYFPAKVDLVLGRLRRLEDALSPVLDGRSSLRELEDRIAATFDEVLTDPQDSEHLVRAHALVRQDPALQAAVATALGATALEATAPAAGGPERRLVLAIAAATVRTAFTAWVESGTDPTPAGLAAEYRATVALRRRLS